MKYTIFKTGWGYFSLAATDNGLLCTCLPLSNPEKVKHRILTSFVGREPSIEFDKALFKTAQEQITAYFEGDCVDFRDVPVVLACPEHTRPEWNRRSRRACPERTCLERSRKSRGNGLGLFARRVLTACRDIGFGQTVSYGRLAEMVGKPGAARAVAGVMAKNPLPLIIPCHRVICADGNLGGFSAAGGVKLKKRMLKLEASNIA